MLGVSLMNSRVRPEASRRRCDKQPFLTVVASTAQLFEVGPKDVEVHALLDSLTVPVEGGLLIKLSRHRGEEGRA